MSKTENLNSNAVEVQSYMMKDSGQEGYFEVCVKGLSFQASEGDIKDYFSQCGPILNAKLLTRNDGKSKGIAFVKFTKKSGFAKALDLDGSEHMGRVLQIEDSQGNRNDGGYTKGSKRGGFGGRSTNRDQNEIAKIETPTLFVGSLSYNSTSESLRDFFAQAGKVSSARIVNDRETGKSRGFGYVEFYDVETAKKAYNTLNGEYLDGRKIRLDSASQRERSYGDSRGPYRGYPSGISKKKAASSESEEEYKEEKPQSNKSATASNMQAAKQESSSEGCVKKVEPANKNELVKVSSNTKESEKEGQSKVAAKQLPASESDDEQRYYEVCVKGISFQAQSCDIKDYFSQCGHILNAKLLTRNDGKSKGIAFVKFTKKSGFNNALDLDGSEHMGRTLTIEDSQGNRNDGGYTRGSKRGGFGGRGANRDQNENSKIETPILFVGNLSFDSTSDSLKDFFSEAGKVSSARIVNDRETGKPRGFGYVEFYDVETAKKAYNTLNGGFLDGRKIRLASQRDRPYSDFGGSYRK